MSDKVIVLPPFNKWSPKFKQTFFERIGSHNSIKGEEDMQFAKEIRLVVRDNKYLIEVDWQTDIVEVLKKELPAGVKSKLVS